MSQCRPTVGEAKRSFNKWRRISRQLVLSYLWKLRALEQVCNTLRKIKQESHDFRENINKIMQDIAKEEGYLNQEAGHLWRLQG
jgi:hypothetical protein